MAFILIGILFFKILFSCPLTSGEFVDTLDNHFYVESIFCKKFKIKFHEFKSEFNLGQTKNTVLLPFGIKSKIGVQATIEDIKIEKDKIAGKFEALKINSNFQIKALIPKFVYELDLHGSKIYFVRKENFDWRKALEFLKDVSNPESIVHPLFSKSLILPTGFTFYDEENSEFQLNTNLSVEIFHEYQLPGIYSVYTDQRYFYETEQYLSPYVKPLQEDIILERIFLNLDKNTKAILVYGDDKDFLFDLYKKTKSKLKFYKISEDIFLFIFIADLNTVSSKGLRGIKIISQKLEEFSKGDYLIADKDKIQLQKQNEIGNDLGSFLEAGDSIKFQTFKLLDAVSKITLYSIVELSVGDIDEYLVKNSLEDKRLLIENNHFYGKKIFLKNISKIQINSDLSNFKINRYSSIAEDGGISLSLYETPTINFYTLQKSGTPPIFLESFFYKKNEAAK